mgnify:CR=1 FL=1
MPWTREQMAERAAQELRDGFYVNLGIGIPTLVSNYIPTGMSVQLQSENGILGMGPGPAPGKADMELINAGKKPVTIVPGAAFFHHADSFALIRSGRIDATGVTRLDTLGVLQLLRYAHQHELDFSTFRFDAAHEKLVSAIEDVADDRPRELSPVQLRTLELLARQTALLLEARAPGQAPP